MRTITSPEEVYRYSDHPDPAFDALIAANRQMLSGEVHINGGGKLTSATVHSCGARLLSLMLGGRQILYERDKAGINDPRSFDVSHFIMPVGAADDETDFMPWTPFVVPPDNDRFKWETRIDLQAATPAPHPTIRRRYTFIDLDTFAIDTSISNTSGRLGFWTSTGERLLFACKYGYDVRTLRVNGEVLTPEMRESVGSGEPTFIAANGTWCHYGFNGDHIRPVSVTSFHTSTNNYLYAPRPPRGLLVQQPEGSPFIAITTTHGYRPEHTSEGLGVGPGARAVISTVISTKQPRTGSGGGMLSNYD